MASQRVAARMATHIVRLVWWCDDVEAEPGPTALVNPGVRKSKSNRTLCAKGGWRQATRMWCVVWWPAGRWRLVTCDFQAR